MSSFIHDMPRLWRTQERCRGFALSNEKFQFIFDSENNLQNVLNAGVWTCDDWSLVLERSVEKQPEDNLQRLPKWVRMRNIPLECYDLDVLMEIAGTIGRVLELAFDPLKPQSRGFIRVRILLDVNKALKNSKQFELPSGEVVNIGFEYERVRKRCYPFQRLTHDKSRCLLNPVNRHRVATVESSDSRVGQQTKLSKEDPLFGDIGLDVTTGRPKIAKEVLDVMQNYLYVQDPSERQARVERIWRKVWNLDNDQQGQGTHLTLEAPATITSYPDDGKGLVFDFTRIPCKQSGGEKTPCIFS